LPELAELPELPKFPELPGVSASACRHDTRASARPRWNLGERGRKLTALLILAAALSLFPACLVLSLNPAYSEDALAWDPNLLGKWHDAEDNVAVEIERGEWRSYRIHYEHPIETGDLTGYLTAIGDARYLDVMPIRGADRGSFLIPVHAVLRVRLEGETLHVTPLSYDWFTARIRASRSVPGLTFTKDQKENVLIASPAAQLRTWLRTQAGDAETLGASATFTRK
jgi:hypothetical protein